MSSKYKFHSPDGIYFTSVAIVKWIDVFTRREYSDIIIDSLQYCIDKKGLVLHAYVILTNHIHLIISRRENALSFSEIMRDFKKFTAMNLIKAIKGNSRESKKEWMLDLFERSGGVNSNNTKYQFWQQDNHPIELEGEWLEEKLNYIHDNPVKAGVVAEAHEYWYSSARNYAGLLSPIMVDSIYDGVQI